MCICRSKFEYGLRLCEEGKRAEARQTFYDLIGDDCVKATDLLFSACEMKNSGLAEIALDLGAKINDVSGGVSPLSIAIRNESPELISMLLANGANIELKVIGDATPLLYAIQLASRSVTPIVAMLLSAGANPNAISRDLGEETPLLAASRRGMAGVAGLLVAAGANPKYVNSAGENYLSVAGRKTRNIIHSEVEMQCNALARKVRTTQSVAEEGKNTNVEESNDKQDSRVERDGE